MICLINFLVFYGRPPYHVPGCPPYHDVFMFLNLVVVNIFQISQAFRRGLRS